MAFAIRNLSVLAYANGFTLWHYKSGKDEVDSICAPGYFAKASDALRAGNIIMINGAIGARTVVVANSDIDTVTVCPLS